MHCERYCLRNIAAQILKPSIKGPGDRCADLPGPRKGEILFSLFPILLEDGGQISRQCIRVRKIRINLKRSLGLGTRCQESLVRRAPAEHGHCDPVESQLSPSEGKSRIELNRLLVALFR